MSDFNLKGADLKKILAVAKKGPLAFGYNPGKTDDETFFGMHRVKAPKVLGKAAKAEGSGKKFSFGTAHVDGKTIFLTCERELPQMAKSLKRYLKSQKIMLNVEVLDGDGNTLDSDSDPASPDGQDGASRSGQGDGGGDDGGDGGSAAQDAQAQVLAARWAETEARLTPVVASAASRGVIDPTRLRADWAVALESASNDDYAGALALAAKIAQAIKNGGGDGHTTPGAADQNIAKWELAKKKIETVVEQALARGAGDVGKIRAVWDFALAKAEASQHAAALKSLVPLSKLLAAAKAAPVDGPAEIEPGTVKARQDDLAQGKALLGALKDMLADIKQAFTILPDREAAIRADIAAVQSAASGNDAAAGQVALTRIKEAIDAAKALRIETINRRDAALASLQALETDPVGTNEAETAAHGAQRTIAQKVLDVEFPTMAALDRADAAIKQLSDTMAITIQRIAETERHKIAIEQALKASVDPDGAHKAETEALAQKRKAVTDQIKDAHPSDQALEKADQALAALKQLLATTNARIEATKRRRAEVAALHKPLETEIARVLKLEGETAIALKLLRKLTFEEAAYAKFMTAEDFDRAAAMVARIKADVAALAAQEVEINKAKKLRDDLLREYKALAPTLKAARKIFPVSPAFDADVKAFSVADYLVGAGLKKRDYASTFARLDNLQVAAKRLLARKDEFEAAVQNRVQAIQKWREANAKRAGIDAFPALLPDVKADCDAFYAAISECNAAFEAKDWEKCRSQAEEALRLSAAILPRRADCLAQTAKMEEAERRYIAVSAQIEPSVGVNRVAPAFARLMEDYESLRDAAVKAFDTDKDFERVLKLVAKLEALAAQFNARKAENSAAATHKSDAYAAYQKVAATMVAAKKIKVYTKEGLAAKTKFDTANQAFVDAYLAGADDVLAKMATAVAAAKDLSAREVAELAKRAEAKRGMETVLAAFRPVFSAATAICDANRPALDAEAEALAQPIAVFNDMSANSRYIEASEALAEAMVVASRIIAAKAKVEAETAKLKPVAEGRWSTAVQADIKTVLAFDDKILPDLPARLGQVFALKGKVTGLLAKGLWQDALDNLDLLDPLLRGLMAQKTLIEKQMADLAWLDSEYVTDKPVLDVAKSISGVNRSIKLKVDEFRGLSGKYFDFRNAHDYTQARAIYPARLAAAKAVAALKAEYEKVSAKYDAANAAWRAVSADHKKAHKYKALTPELRGLLDSLSQVESHFDDAYFGFDYDAAVTRAPAIGVAARAVIAAATAKVTITASDGSTSQVDAYEKIKQDVDKAASDAETTLESISASDLKSKKTAEEKVALLDALRGQKEKLTDKQRELQRKIYASMEMDAEFVAQDDKRRAELTKAISQDKELMAAKDKWATMDVAKRIALLQKTLKTECAIYGMPVPTVQVFEEPMPGDLGSFNSGTNVIRINVHPSATFDDFHDTIDTIVHENAHNYQGYLVTRLNEGLLTPGDPEYKQALMFASNSVAQSYVNGDEDHDIYMKQPLEDHAWKTGDGVKYALIALPPGGDDKGSDEVSDEK